MAKLTGVEAAKVTLVDEIRDDLLQICKDMPDVWQKLGETREGDFIERVSLLAGRLVGKACDTIAADGREAVQCTVGDVTLKKTVAQAKVSIPIDSPEVQSFGRASNGMAVLAFVDRSRLMEEGKRPKATPDQGDLYDPKAKDGVATAIQEGLNKAEVKTKRHEGLPDPASLPKSAPVPESTKPKTRRRRKTTRDEVKVATGPGQPPRTVAVERKKTANGPDLELVE